MSFDAVSGPGRICSYTGTGNSTVFQFAQSGEKTKPSGLEKIMGVTVTQGEMVLWHYDKEVKFDISGLSPKERAAIPTLFKCADNIKAFNHNNGAPGILDRDEQTSLSGALQSAAESLGNGLKLTGNALILVMLEQAALYGEADLKLEVNNQIINMSKGDETKSFIEGLNEKNISESAVYCHALHSGMEDGFVQGLLKRKNRVFHEMTDTVWMTLQALQSSKRGGNQAENGVQIEGEGEIQENCIRFYWGGKSVKIIDTSSLSSQEKAAVITLLKSYAKSGILDIRGQRAFYSATGDVLTSEKLKRIMSERGCSY